ncbi:phage protein NinX family protein [Klebsiella aerogenes]|uniref:phage protein NinX family protein n=1 Tax=Klebsiella aerogenes TaxID=548 RepID=UPI003A8EADEA
MVKVKTADLTGRALDWAAFCAAWPGATPTIEVYPTSKVNTGLGEIDVPGGVALSYEGSYRWKDYWRPTKNWEQAGRLIDRFDIDINPTYPGYFACAKMGMRASGDTRLIAVCRALVLAKLGDEVDIPDELID